MKTAYDIIIRPVITEKSMEAVGDKKYVFEVATDANKVEIRKAIEEIFGVKVLSVNTINVSGKAVRGRTGKMGRKPDRKKAIIRLTEDSKTIEMFEGMV
ncbi:MAG: 50S ribosomal protein L23 [Clostridia bacterium]|jgi:Ribosomal protein L23|nr:50S ribosomal protein L23 [Clostridia bacterium]